VIPDPLIPSSPPEREGPAPSRPEVDLVFGQQAERLEQEGQGDEARHLLEAGVVTHPWYATGHYLLGRRYLAESRWPEARLELERALQLEGSYPASLEALAVCYERLGLGDLARGCRALGRDLDPRPLTSAEEALEMTDEPTREPGGTPEPEEAGKTEQSPEDALAELEALLEGASGGLEGTATAEEPVEPAVEEPGATEPEIPVEPAVEEPEATEPEIPVEPEAQMVDEALEVESGAPDTSGMSEEEKAAIWKKILEQADQAGESPAVGAGDEEPAAAGTEGLETTEGEPAGENKEDLWKKILEQAEQLEGAGEETPAVTPGTEPGDMAEAGTGDQDVDAGAFEIESDEVTGSGLEVEPVELEGVATGEGEVEVAPLEGLEVSTPGGMADYEEVAAQQETSAADSVEEEPAGPEETETETEETPADVLSELEQTLDGLEPTGVVAAEEWSVGGLDEPAGEEETGPEEAVPILGEVDEEVGSPEDALKALEAELGGETPAEPSTEVQETPIIEDSLDSLESLEAIEDLETTEVGALEETPEPPQEETEEEPAPVEQVAATAGAGGISTPDNAIRQAIKADILAAQGKKEEATRILEALLLWDPERTGFKERLESLRRTE